MDVKDLKQDMKNYVQQNKNMPNVNLKITE